MKFLQHLRIPYVSDIAFGFLFFAALTVPLVLVLPLPDPIELPKFVILLLCVGVSLIAMLLRRETWRTVFPRFFLAGLVFIVLWSVISTIFSLDIVNSLVGITIRLTNSVLFFSVWALWIFLLSLQEREQFIFLVKTVVVSAGVVGLWGLFQYLGIGYYGGLAEGVRSSAPSFLGNPNFTAMFLVPASFLAVWSFATTRNFVWRMIFVLVLGLSLVNVLVLTSRGALLGLFAGGVTMLFFTALYKKKLSILVGVSVILFLTAAFFYSQAVRPQDTQGLASLSDTTTQERFLVWNATMDYIAAHPLVGSGPGNFFLAYRQMPYPELSNLAWFDDTHNLILHVAVNEGMPAAIGLCVLILLALINGYFAIREKSEHSFFAVCLLSALAGWLVAASFNPVTIANWMVFGIILAGLYQVRPKPQTFDLKRSYRLAAVGFSALLLLIGVLLISSDIAVWQARVAQLSNNTKRAMRLASIAVFLNPSNINAYETGGVVALTSGDFTTMDQMMIDLQKLHPLSAGSSRKAMHLYYFAYGTTKDPQYKQKFYETLSRYMAINPNHSQTYQDAAYALMKIGNYSAALPVAKKNVVHNSKSAYSWMLLSKVYVELGDSKKAIAAFEQSFQLLPTSLMRVGLQDSRVRAANGIKILLPIDFGEIQL